MGGSLFLTPVRSNSDDEYEESSVFDAPGEEEDPSNTWYYRYSGFTELKGVVLRGAIGFLTSVQQKVDERKAAGNIVGSRQYLSQAGIIAAATSPTDEKALADASAAIASALRLLRTWLREPDSRNQSESGTRLPFFDQMLLAAASSSSRAESSERLLNMNISLSETLKHEFCPPVLHRVGLSGLYHYFKLWDHDQCIYPPEARLMGESLGRAIEFMPDEDWWKESARELRDLLNKCGEHEMSMIRG